MSLSLHAIAAARIRHNRFLTQQKVEILPQMSLLLAARGRVRFDGRFHVLEASLLVKILEELHSAQVSHFPHALNVFLK